MNREMVIILEDFLKEYSEGKKYIRKDKLTVDKYDVKAFNTLIDTGFIINDGNKYYLAGVYFELHKKR